jgi:uncharacterized protein (TIGR03086 family)
VLAAFDAGVRGSVAAFGAAGDKPVELPFGTLPASVFVIIAANDQFTHAWDLATATGQDADLAPDLADELLAGARQLIGLAVRGPEGSGAPFGPEQEAPADSTSAAKLAAFLGRTP